MPAPERIKQLVATFEQNINEYRFNKNETELRRQFLDPFFEALGWDVDNKQGRDERHKEVAHEYSVEIDGQQKKADYAFRTEKDIFDFLVEAKKPSVKVESSREAAFQIRRYGWSAKIPINILTDFEHFAVYDCRTRPNFEKDKATTGRISILHYKEYVEKWDEIAALFSPEAIRGGALEQYKDELKGKKGTQEVDDAFLEEIEGWREALAKNIATRNKAKNLNEDQINFAVQMTIDRIIFLRIAEERGMEKDRRLFELAETPSVLRTSTLTGTRPPNSQERNLGENQIYKDLLKYFAQADDRYNSGLFHFKKDKDRANPDTLSGSLEIDDKVLKDIIKDLYYPSPYAFNYIPTEILGSVYERFLGKVIRLTAGGSAKVEEKPEVRKAGGVYYTPAYIVEYIVKNTVGKLLEGKTPDEVSKIKIVDPACGSGSFLLGAYQYLLDWHLDWYVSNTPEKHVKNKTLLTIDQKTYRLSLEEKKRILLNNIHGVDLDTQAVEVTKLSLLLKVVEDPGQLKMFDEGHILPNLNKNIKNGNALIGTDYFDGQMFGDMDEMKRVKPFDWKSEFPEVFQRGGFDAVIGNPPYIRSQTLLADQRDYFNKVYKTATKTYDIYVLFVEKAVSMLSEKGYCGFILPNKFFTTDYGEGLRKLLGSNKLIDKIVDFEDGQIFTGAGTYTNLLFLKNNSTNEPKYTALGSVYKEKGNQGLEDILLKTNIDFQKIKITEDGSRWTIAAGAQGDVLLKAQASFPPFANFSPHIFQGLKTSADKIYLVKVIKENENLVTIENGLKETAVIEKNILQRVIKGEDAQRYFTDMSQNLFIIYPYVIEETGKATLISANVLERDYPQAWEYINQYKKMLGARDNGIWSSRADWYAYARGQNIGTFLGEKFLVPYMTTRLKANLDKTENLFFVNITTGGYGFRLKVNEKSEYILALLNSKFLDYSIQQMTNKFRGGYFAVNKQGVERLPYRAINFGDPVEKAMHDQMVLLVEKMLTLHKSMAAAKNAQESELFQRQITSTDRQIDELVYKLYGLTEDEVKIVEGK